MARFRSLLLIATISLVGGFGGASFPENRVPISVTAAHDVPSSFFTGGSSASDALIFTQDVKLIKVAGRQYFAVTGREKLFLIQPREFSPSLARKIPYTEVYTWETADKTRKLCVLKGQSEENCENYIRVVEQMDDNGDKLLVCATNSYDPQCLYLTASTVNNEPILSEDGETFSGEEKCAFGPDQTGVSLFTGNSLYSATASEFSGRSYTIARSLGDAKQLRTPKFDAKYLHAPSFVKMIDDGERVLVFMNERVQTENGDVRMVAYVAQVCKNDVGGRHVLVRQWTKFEKTRLNCSRNGFYFDRLQGVSDPVDVQLDGGTTEKTIYATFTTPEFSVPGSAVCAFTVNSIHKALLGRFREERATGGSKSSVPSGSKHPGKCPGEPYTESELLFLKSHPLIEDQALGALLTTHVGERWTSVAVDSTAGPNRNWTVYFVGTTEGQLLRYLAPTGGLKNTVFLRRQDVFNVERCGNVTEENKSVTHIVADPERNQLLISFKHCVISIPLRSCFVHKCKKSCIASADPYCGWNGTDCVDHMTPSVNIEQYVYTQAMHPSTDIGALCSRTETYPVPGGNSESGQVVVTTAKKDKRPSDGKSGKENGSNFNFTTGAFVDDRAVEDGRVPHKLGTVEAAKNGYIKWHFVIIIAVITGILFFAIGFAASKKCSPIEKDVEKKPEGNASKSGETLCKRIIATLSPKRSRRQSHGPATPSRSTLTTDPHCEALVPRIHSKEDEYVKSQDISSDDKVLNSKPSHVPDRNSKSRLHSASTTSQVTVTESLPNYNTNNRHSSSQLSASTISVSKGRPNYATAPHGRHYMGNRTSDPSDYSNYPTMRVDRVPTRITTRHSTPTPILPPSTPTSVIGSSVFSFSGDSVIEDVQHAVDGVQKVLEQQQQQHQRISVEMETVMEESDEPRLRHDSNDSGKGSSARNSVETEDHDKVPTLSRSKPDVVLHGKPRGRKRLNSEPTSPTVTQRLPPPSSHEPTMHYQNVIPRQQSPRKRSESLSHHQPHQVTLTKKGPPLKMHQMVQNGFQPRANPNVYECFPAKPQTPGDGQTPAEKFRRQQSYDTYSPHGRYVMLDQRNHPAMNLPDQYSSLPLRSQAHRSNKRAYPPPQYAPHLAQTTHRNSGAPQKPPPFHKQISSPATFDPQRGQRPRYVPTPTVPAPLREQDAV